MRRTRPCVAVTWLLAAAIFVKRPAAQVPSPPPPFPPPGRLVDIGGWRLHVNCTGESSPGQPTVILEAGLGDFSVEWSLVQPRVARFARVCSYDRGGDGWSDLGPDPRTLHQIAGEWRTLLQKAEVSPPYVLVGHSYGGWLVRLYSYSYPGEVSGMVLVDAGEEEGPNANTLEADHRKEQAATATLSTAGKLVIATRSAHHIQLDEPDLVSQAISDVQQAVRK
jgi:hypothetical protein